MNPESGGSYLNMTGTVSLTSSGEKSSSQSCLVDADNDQRDLEHTYELIRSVKLSS